MNNYALDSKIFNVLIVVLLFSATLYMKLNYSSSDIADYEAYAQYTEIYWRGWDKGWLTSEPLGWGMLIALRSFTNSTDQAITLAHWMLIVFVFGAFLTAAIFYRVKWQGVLISVAMFGPLLSMVTIRATPAYLLCISAALIVSKRPRVGVMMVAVAAAFHNTALLALGPVILIILQRKMFNETILNNNKFMLFCFYTIAAIFALFFRETVFSLTEQAIYFFPAPVEKYLIYILAGGGDFGSNRLYNEISVFNTLFFSGVAILLIAYLIMIGEEQKPYYLFILASFVIFTFCSLNPVVSYRQSIFWVIPALLTFPWEKVKPNSVVGVGVIAFSAIAFFLNLDGVLAE